MFVGIVWFCLFLLKFFLDLEICKFIFVFVNNGICCKFVDYLVDGNLIVFFLGIVLF